MGAQATAGDPAGEVDEEIRRRLRAQRMRGDFAGIHAAPSGAVDVPDQAGARLVVLGPEHPHRGGDADSPALELARRLLEDAGEGTPRRYRNMLVFLAGDAARLEDLRDAVRRYLAAEAASATGAAGADEARGQARTAGDAAGALIGETWQWLLAPSPGDAWTVSRAEGRQELAMRASRRLRDDGSLFVDYPAPRLRADLDGVPIWAPGTDHVGLAEVWEAYATSVALPRLRSSAVLAAAIVNGVAAEEWATETFAYAESWDAERGRYEGLAAGRRVALRGTGLLVKARAATRQLAAEPGEE